MRTEENLVDSGLTIIHSPLDEAERLGLTIGDAPSAASVPTSTEEELHLAERMLVGQGKMDNFYTFFGLRNFQDISETEVRAIGEKKDRLVNLAETEWGSNEKTERRLKELVSAIQVAATKLTSQGQKINFDKDLRAQLLLKLGTLVDQYLRSNQIGSASIEIDEYVAIMEVYEANRVLSPDRPKEIADFHQNFHMLVEEKKGAFIDLDTEFIEAMKKLPRRDFIDIPEKRSAIAERYRKLKEADHYIKTLQWRELTEKEVMPAVETALRSVGLGLQPKEEVFEAEVFIPFADKLGIRNGGQIDSFNYGQLVVKARDEYYFTEGEVLAFCTSKGVAVKAEMELKFNFGVTSDRSRKLEAKSYEEIVALFEEFPEKATMKLYDGDLEVYLDNLGNSDLSEKIKGICQEYREENEYQAGLRKTIYTLLPARPYKTPGGIECSGIEELGDAIEREFNGYKQSLLAERNHEALLFLEARGAREVAHEVRVWTASDKGSDKRLNGIIWVLQGKQFKRGGAKFSSVDQVVRLDDVPLKKKLATELADIDSKFAVWIEECFENLLKNVDKWRRLKRYNDVTIGYALEARSPFHYEEERAHSPSDFAESVIRKHALDKDFLPTLLDLKSALRIEVEFWLKEYHSSDCVSALRMYLSIACKDKSLGKANDMVVSSLVTVYGNRGVQEYGEELLPLVEEAQANGTIASETFDRHRDGLIKLVNSKVNATTDGFVHSYLKERLKGPDIDNVLALAFFRYFMRASVDRDFYVGKIQPLLEEAVKLGVVEGKLLEEQRKYFLEKYEQNIVAANFDEKLAIISAMKALDVEHPLVTLYEKSANSIRDCVKRQNALDRMKNALRRDLLLAVSMVATLAISFLPSLHLHLSWSPVSVNVPMAGGIVFFALLAAIPVGIVIIRKLRS